MKKLLMVMMAVMLLFTAMPTGFAATGTFKDVPRNHWAYDAIKAMAEKGVIQGYNDGTFRPNNLITRAEFAKIMIAAAGINVNSKQYLQQTFDDVDRNHWAFKYVELAKNYLTGYKTGNVYTYKPDDVAVREDIAVALVRLKGLDSKKKADLSLLSQFRDQSNISVALRPYIALALDNDLIKGYDDKTFRPQNSITRAEAASLLYRAQLDEEKIVFPAEPEPEKPEAPISITDNFSKDDLSNWREDDSEATWAVDSGRVTGYALNSDAKHYFLPLKWKEETKPNNYQIQVDVIAKGTNGQGGLFFNGNGKRATVVFFEKDKLVVGEVTNPNTKEVKRIANVNYKLQSTNKLKIVVKGDSYSIYINDKYVIGQENQSIKDTTLGLYLQKEATLDLPDKVTFFDNFSFKVLQ